MPPQLVTIAKYNDNFEAGLAKAFLEDNGILAFLTNELAFSMAPGILPERFFIELQVSAEFEQRARNLLDNQLRSADVQSLLTEEQAVLEGHFVLTSGRHSGMYVEKIKVLQNPQAAMLVCEMLEQTLEAYDFDTVVGPAYGGIVLAFETARLMSKYYVFTQRKDEKMTIRGGFDLSETRKVVVIEDIVTTGGSVKEVIDCLRERGIEVVAVAAIVDRSGGKADFGVPFHSLLQLDIPTWDPSDCELCKQGIPLTKPGSSDKKA